MCVVSLGSLARAVPPRIAVVNPRESVPERAIDGRGEDELSRPARFANAESSLYGGAVFAKGVT